ncbi:MAG: dTMP kinase [Armatimonadetes bacterium]|nr:dTMP kinase [Armatimonadota bacterium]
MPGLFITLEGIDGCGKTTQARLLAEGLRTAGHSVCLTREPGGTEEGEEIRELLLSPERTIPPGAELFLYLADRSIHIAEVVRPALAEGRIVVCERHTDSTLAYQGYGRGLDLGLLGQLNVLATGHITPNLTIVLDLDPAQARLDANRLDRLESEGETFLARVAEGFRRLARDEPERVKLADGSAAVGVVQAEVADLVERLIERQPRREGQAKEGS